MSFLYLVFLFLELAAAVAGLVIALVRRGQAPARATLGALGFGLLAFSVVTTLLSSLMSRLLLTGDDSNYAAYIAINIVLSVVRMLAFAGGAIVLALALFRTESANGPPQQQGYPGAPYDQQYTQQYGAPPQQPYQSPGHQSPPATQQWPQPGQQPPPGQPPPGQQPYPWQQPPPGQQYPGY